MLSRFALHAERDRGRDQNLPYPDAEVIGAISGADRRKALSGCKNATGVRAAIAGLCAEFGEAVSIYVLPVQQSGRPRAVCFLRMATPAQEGELMRALGASRFGDDVLVVVDLDASPQPAAA